MGTQDSGGHPRLPWWRWRRRDTSSSPDTPAPRDTDTSPRSPVITPLPSEGRPAGQIEPPAADASRAIAPISASTPPAEASKQDEPPWIARVTQQIMESDTLHRMQAAVGSQIPPLVAALGGALSRLSEPQRRWLADDLVRDLQFIKKVCKELSASDELSGPTQLIAAFDKLEYIAERLATYYEHYKRQLETSVPRLTIHPLTPEERVAMKKWMRGMNAKGAADFGERHIVARANKTITAIEKMLGYLQEEVEGKIVTKRVIHADELTLALGEVAALAESVYQELRGMYRELWEASQPMPRRLMGIPRQIRGFRKPSSSKKQPKK